ncbi:MAG: FAD-binding oxidoreductase [Sphingobacteriales bacterium]|nr:FAD-binding oxidoreductase [Sphingobacteriales bacterium]OJY86411.1 MAG: FAD-binding oxidoreductase [Sphingobacteriales bacterium 44-15]
MRSFPDIGKQLEAIIPPERIKTRLIDLVAYASDAGFYYLRPKAVVQPVSEEEVQKLFAFSREHRIPLTFRAAGTSLSGQSVTDGILADISQHWRGVFPEQDGATVRVQPGITGAMVNAHLRKFRRKIGPDPSSINSAMMGGILSNNSSGMCCGVHLNAYHTTRHIRFILPDGKIFSTALATDYDRFEKECRPIHDTISRYRDAIMADKKLHDRIRHKYQTKNTVGYALNAFIDHHHPLDILAHLLIGGEGTLGFIAEAILETVPDHPFKSTGLLYFPDIYKACEAIVPLIELQAEAVELMDRASLRSIEHIEGVPAIFKTLPPEAAALLIEFQGNTEAEVSEKRNAFVSIAQKLSMLEAPVFTEDKKQQAFLWKLRKGMFPAVGAVRQSGTTVILEDIAFPVPKLGDAIVDLQSLFQKHGYDNAIIFGHAKDGNIHFVVTQTFNEGSEVQRYARFIEDVVELVVNKYDGALKAEHGTGRNMAPFVETEWGSDAYQIMKGIKEAVDPDNLLNPGVIINDDRNAHLKNLKPLPTVEEEVDKCIECGYCEHVCPSRDLTLTPRRRIVVRRELALLKGSDNPVKYKELQQQYVYDGLETCAVDGLCAMACPVDINTGDLVKRLRAEQHSPRGEKTAVWVVKYFSATVHTIKFALQSGQIVNRIFGKSAMTRLTTGIRKIIPAFPQWSPQLAAGATIKKATADNNTNYSTSIVYFPACISRMMGGLHGKQDIAAVFTRVSEKAGIRVLTPGNINTLCCGQMFSSKGYREAYALMCNKTIASLWDITNKGKIAVVLDVSSCTHTLLHCRKVLSPENQAKFDELRIIDSVEYIDKYILPSVKVVQKKPSVALHPVCSVRKMNATDTLVKVARHFADRVEIPKHEGCCGMAGDRGFLFPELTQAATLEEAKEIKVKQCDGYYSTSKPCEMAMSEAVGKQFESILYLVDETT